MSKITMFHDSDSFNFMRHFIRDLSKAWSELSDIAAGDGEIVLTLAGSDDVLTLTGSGFSVDGDGNLTGGTVTAVTMRDGGTLYFRIRDIAIEVADFAEAFDNGTIIEIADLFGPMAISGSEDADVLFGSSGNDVMHANGGSDLLTGNAGADLLDGGKGLDGVSYMDGRGVTVSLLDPSRNTGDAQGDRYRSIEAVLGSEFKDNVQGDQRKNFFAGLGGDDNLSGLGGHDFLAGGKGADILTGGGSADMLAGEGGKDIFVYTELADSGVDKQGRDEISDFNGGGIDVIDLSQIDAVAGGGDDEFAFIGGDEFTALGQIRVSLKGNNTLIELNIEGNKAADMAILLNGDLLARIDKSDFIL